MGLFTDAIKECDEECIGYVKRKAKKEWVTNEMIEKMDEARKWQTVNTEVGKQQYRKLNNELRWTTDKAKEKWLNEQSQEIEELERMGRSDLVYQKGREIHGEKRNSWKVHEAERRNEQTD